MSQLRTLAILAVAGLALAGCGGDTSDRSSEAPSRTTRTVSVDGADASTTPSADTSATAEVTAQAGDEPTAASDGRSDAAGEPTTQSSSTAASTGTSASTSAGQARPAAARRLEVTITALNQIPSKLAGTSPDFTREMERQFVMLAEESTEADCHPRIGVEVYWADQQAWGDVGSCGGASMLWWKPAGSSSWKSMGTQEVMDCQAMRSERVPLPMTVAEFGGCAETPGGAPTDYRP